jgi:hypothetical protein
MMYSLEYSQIYMSPMEEAWKMQFPDICGDILTVVENPGEQ